MDLDFTNVTDDQLIELVRQCCLEAARRGDSAVAEALKATMLSEAERVRVARSASEAEIAALRAQERERIAQEARDKARAEHEAAQEPARRAQARAEAEAAAAKAKKELEAAGYWLRRFAELVDREPSTICITIASTKYGRRVLINRGSDLFAREHLIDYNMSTYACKTIRALIKRKPDIVSASAELGLTFPQGVSFVGTDYDWGV